MSAIQIQGLRPLKGTVGIQGSKNAVLPMMAASLLADGVTVIRHVPEIEDVFSMMGILESLGCKCSLEKGVLTVDTKASSGHRIPEEYVGKMRSSCLLLGPLLAGRGAAVTYYPGGCVIGKRPIDLHLYALKRLGASFFEAGGMILARADRLRGARIRFSYPSVGATENAILAAVTAEGETEIENCAREPEIMELCRVPGRHGSQDPRRREEPDRCGGRKASVSCGIFSGRGPDLCRNVSGGRRHDGGRRDRYGSGAGGPAGSRFTF